MNTIPSRLSFSYDNMNESGSRISGMPLHRPNPARGLAAVATTLLLSFGGVIAAQAAPLTLDPTLAGTFAAGTGANATFTAIDGNWRGSATYWNETMRSYSNTAGAGYQPIGSYAWGTGLWGLTDWRTAQDPASGLATMRWSGQVATINQGDDRYASDAHGAATWGPALPVPLFAGSNATQDNWTSHYTGYLRIEQAGSYNFGVLYDDGFFLRIHGAGDQYAEISSDFLSSRDRLGFEEDLLLGTGLYAFELGSFDRLEIGVVNLAWRSGGDSDWITVPTSMLVTDPRPQTVPVPATAGLLALGVALLASRRRKSAPA